MTECYRRFNNGTYLLTCGLDEGHNGPHQEMDGEETWPAEAGWSDDYTGAPIKFDPDRVPAELPLPPPPPPPEPKAVFGSFSGSIAERLAARKEANASLKKTPDGNLQG